MWHGLRGRRRTRKPAHGGFGDHPGELPCGACRLPGRHAGRGVYFRRVQRRQADADNGAASRPFPWREDPRRTELRRRLLMAAAPATGSSATTAAPGLAGRRSSGSSRIPLASRRPSPPPSGTAATCSPSSIWPTPRPGSAGRPGRAAACRPGKPGRVRRRDRDPAAGTRSAPVAVAENGPAVEVTAVCSKPNAEFVDACRRGAERITSRGYQKVHLSDVLACHKRVGDAPLPGHRHGLRRLAASCDGSA